MLAAPAVAQESEVSEVVISGTRAVRDGSQAPTPVAVVSVEQLNLSNPRNIGEALAALPVFRNSMSPSTPGTGSQQNFAANSLNLRGLNENANTKTLTLMDGRRVIPNGNTWAVDVAMLPQSLFRRVDVVTGGASAAYGSDAVAGVVNFILDTRFEGIRGKIQGGISDVGDVGSYNVEISAGAAYLDNRLHVIASYGNRRSNYVPSVQERRFGRVGAWHCQNDLGKLPLQNLCSNVGVYIYPGGLSDWRYATTATRTGGTVGTIQQIGQSTTGVTTAGTIAAAMGGPLKFLPNPQGGLALVSPFNPGIRDANNNVGQFSDGFPGSNNLASLVESENSYLRATFDVSDNLEIWADYRGGKTHNLFNAFPRRFDAIQAYVGNPFIPTWIAGQMNSTATGNNFLYSVINPKGENTGGEFRNNVNEVAAGFRSQIFGDYRLDGYYSYGRNIARNYITGNVDKERFYAAIDAIRNTATGEIQCAVLVPTAQRPTTYFGAAYSATQAARFAGCAPYNGFGFGNVSEAARDYVSGTSLAQNEIVQQVAAVNIAGEPFGLPAGDVTVAFGLEYRELEENQTIDARMSKLQDYTGLRVPAAISGPANQGQQGVWVGANSAAYSGVYRANEAYLEFQVPILKDVFLAKSFEINAAGRWTDYSTSGVVKTWKLGAVWQPVEGLRFRGAKSLDIRAPNFTEGASISAIGNNFNDPLRRVIATNALENYRINARRLGYSGLKPEEADTTTYGVVIQPAWLPRLTMSIDYWKIAMTDVVASQAAGTVLNNCSLDPTSPNNVDCAAQVIRDAPVLVPGSDPVCAGIVLNAAGQCYTRVYQLDAYIVNGDLRDTAGVDVEISYRTPIMTLPGEFDFRLLATYLSEDVSSTSGVINTYAGQVGDFNRGAPRVRGSLQVNYTNGPVSIFWQQTYVGHGTNLNVASATGIPIVEGIDIDDNTIGSYTTSDLTGTYTFGEEGQYAAFLSVKNLFDKDPLTVSSLTTGSAATSAQQTNNRLYDTIGRYYTTGLRFRF